MSSRSNKRPRLEESSEDEYEEEVASTPSSSQQLVKIQPDTDGSDAEVSSIL